LNKPLYIIFSKIDFRTDKEIDELVTHTKDFFKSKNITIKGYIPFSTRLNTNKYLSNLIDILKSLASNNSKNYLSDLVDCVDSAKKNITTAFNNKMKEKNENESKYEKAKIDYDRYLSKLQDHCLDLKCSLRCSLQNNWIFENKYELSQLDGRKLLEFLNDISTFENIKNYQDKIESAQNEMNESASALKEISAIKNSIERIICLLKRQIQEIGIAINGTNSIERKNQSNIHESPIKFLAHLLKGKKK